MRSRTPQMAHKWRNRFGKARRRSFVASMCGFTKRFMNLGRQTVRERQAAGCQRFATASVPAFHYYSLCVRFWPSLEDVVVLPLIPVVLIGTGLVTGSGGAVLGVKGGLNLKKSKTRLDEAQSRYDDARSRLESHETRTNELLVVLGGRQEDAIHLAVERMAAFLRRHEKQVAESDKLLADGLDVEVNEVVLGRELGQDAISWARGVVGSTVAGVGVNVGLTSAATAFASASTGTAISSLSGAAATSATGAFFGGGSLAAGGGGMALGATALNFVTIGPAVLVAGFVVAGQGEKAKTKAREYEAAVNEEVASMTLTHAAFDAIASRVTELEDLLAELLRRSVDALDVLESEPFDPSHHASRFHSALALAVAVRDVACAQVVDESGALTETSAAVSVRYRALIKERTDA